MFLISSVIYILIAVVIYRKFVKVKRYVKNVAKAVKGDE